MTLEDNLMLKKPLIGFSILVVVILILSSLGNVVGYQTVQTSQQNHITENINQEEILYQTILDMSNNEEIQQILHKSPNMKGRSLLEVANLLKPITKQQRRQMYDIGLFLSERISTSTIKSMIQTHQLITSDILQQIDVVLKNNHGTSGEVPKLVNSDCDCEPEGFTLVWRFPVICTFLLVMMGLVFFSWFLLMVFLMVPPSALHEMLELLAFGLYPFLIPYQLLNCPVPEGNNHPFPSDISPADGEQNVSLDLNELSFRLTDEDNDLMSYKVTTNPNIGEGEGELVPNGTYTIPIYGLQENTNYRWDLFLYEGDLGGTPVRHKYSFKTEAFTPFILNPSPIDNSEFVQIITSNVSFDLADPQHELMNWTVETQPDIGSGEGTGVPNGRYTVPISGLDYFTKYTWFVNVTDGIYWAKKTFSFRTTTENTVVIEPTDDATISEPDPNVNSGNSDSIILRNTETWNLEGLIKFNLSAVPSNVTIMIAGLQAFYHDNEDGNPSGNQVNLYRITSDWDEETVTWNNQPSYVGEPSSSAIIPATINNWVYWNATGDTLLFYDGSTPNYGWRLKDITFDWDNAKIYFRSKDYIEYHPHLIIGYE